MNNTTNEYNEVNKLRIKDAKLVMWRRNFAGKKFGKAEAGRFAVYLDSGLAKYGTRSDSKVYNDHNKLVDKMKYDNWNIKYDDEGRPYIDVIVKFGDYPPSVTKYDTRTKECVELDSETVECLDSAHRDAFDYVELCCKLSHYVIAFGQGYTSYLQVLNVTMTPVDVGNMFDYDDEDVENDGLPF